jgi:DNA repair protein RecO (recombination protein O)
MASFSTRGLILKRYPLGEKDKLCVLLTPTYGKLRISARGARQSSSKLAGVSEPMVILDAHLHKGTTFHVLAQAEAIETFPVIKTDISLISFAMFLLELVDRLTEDEDPAPDLYELLVRTLYLLTASKDPASLVLAAQWHILHITGYMPRIRDCCICEVSLSSSSGLPFYAAHRGGVICHRCADGYRGETLAFTRPLQAVLYTIGDLITPADWSSFAVEESLKPMLWQLVRSHMKAMTDRDLKTMVFLDALRFDAIGKG